MSGMVLLSQKNQRLCRCFTCILEVSKNDGQRLIQMAMHSDHTPKRLTIKISSVGYVVHISPPPEERKHLEGLSCHVPL